MSTQTIVLGIVAAVSFAAWWLIYGVERFLNGCSERWLIVLVWEDFLFALPGSRRRKGNYIRECMGDLPDGAMISSTGSWDYQEIRDGNLYDDVGEAMLPGFWHFVGMHILLPFGPTLVTWYVFFSRNP